MCNILFVDELTKQAPSLIVKIVYSTILQSKKVMSLHSKEQNKSVPPLEENLKKATTELLILHLLEQREYYIGELSAALHEKSDGALTVVFPYAAIYRLQDAEYISEVPRRIAPDGRRRQYFKITAKGIAYLNQLREVYAAFTRGVARIFDEGNDSNE